MMIKVQYLFYVAVSSFALISAGDMTRSSVGPGKDPVIHLRDKARNFTATITAGSSNKVIDHLNMNGSSLYIRAKNKGGLATSRISFKDVSNISVLKEMKVFNGIPDTYVLAEVKKLKGEVEEYWVRSSDIVLGYEHGSEDTIVQWPLTNIDSISIDHSGPQVLVGESRKKKLHEKKKPSKVETKIAEEKAKETSK